LIAKPAMTVKELLRQVGETEVVISPRYHNLVVALLQGKPVIALSDHAKLDSLATDFGLARYRISLGGLHLDDLINKFNQLQNDAPQLRRYVRARSGEYRQAVTEQYAIIFPTLSGTTQIDGALR
jgi:polysaccharide pyruvyl transferase WcaK-like protein